MSVVDAFLDGLGEEARVAMRALVARAYDRGFREGTAGSAACQRVGDFRRPMLLEGVTRLEDRTIGMRVPGLVPGAFVTMKSVGWSGSQAIEVIFEDIGGQLDRNLVVRDDEHQLESTRAGRPWSVKGDGRLFSLGQWRIKRADLNRWIDAQPRGGDGGRDGD